MKYSKEKAVMTEKVREAYEKCYSRHVATNEKKPFDVVTEIDVSIEKFLIGVISESFPGDRILSEEINPEVEVAGRTWTIDPIDGTYNMTRDIPLYGVQCGLYEDGEVVFSVIYLPYFDELCTAAKGEGAYANGRRLSVSRDPLDKCVFSLGDFQHGEDEDCAAQQRIIGNINGKIARIRMFGAACLDFVFVAEGKTDGCMLFTRNKWDIAPGMLLAKEAGAEIYSLEGEYTKTSRSVIATGNRELYECIVESSKR